jgi:DNA-binding PadR family transcriptional regulator
MTNARAGLTELEGAILGVLSRASGLTTYAVRSVFVESRSAEWSGSAGAVYPALARLRKAGLVSSRTLGDKRGSKLCELTKAGVEAHQAWVCDVARAAGPGLDPFRVRAADLWALPGRKRAALIADLTGEIEARRSELRSALAEMDQSDRVMTELHIALLETRLAWLKRI